MTRMTKLPLVALVVVAAWGLHARTARAGGDVFQSLLNTDIWPAAVYQPPYDQTEVFVIGDDGALWTVWKARGETWRPPVRISPQHLAQPGAPIAAVFYPPNNQLEVFFVGLDGTLWDVWKANNGPWQAPGRLSAANFAPSGGHVAAIFQPINNQLEVFLIDSSENLRVIWKANNGRWTMDPPLPSNMSAREGTALSAIYWPYGEALEVFLVGRDGSVRHAFKEHNGAWNSDTISRPNFAPTGAPIAPVSYPNGNAVEVFVIGGDGTLRGVWKQPGHNWTDDIVFGPPDRYSPRAPISAVYQPRNDQLEVFAVSKNGAIWDTWKAKEVGWQTPFPVTRDRDFRDGTPLVAFVQGSDHMDVIAANDDAVLYRAWKTQNGSWHSDDRMTGPFITPLYSVAECARAMNSHRLGQVDFAACFYIVGLAQYCESQDAFVIETFDAAGRASGWACAPFSHPDTVLEQIDHIARGVTEGLETAFTASLPYLGAITAGATCVTGVVVGCAALAVEVARLAGAPVPGVPPEVVQAATQALGCVAGDVFACTEFALQGARVAGVTIPGVDVVQVAADADLCKNGNFAACMRLGLTAASAAGVSVGGVGAGDVVNTRDCLAGATQACVALGGRLARLAGFPLDRLTQGVATAQRCFDGDTNACIALGREAARVTGLPLGDLPKGVENAQRCAAGDTNACIALGRGAAQAAHIPLGGVDQALASAENVRKCAGGDQAACTAIGRALVGSTVADGVSNAQKCVGGDQDACVTLGRGLAGSGLAQDATKALRCEHGDRAACLDMGKTLAARAGLPNGVPPLPPFPSTEPS